MDTNEQRDGSVPDDDDSGAAHEYRLEQARALLRGAGYEETYEGSGEFIKRAGGNDRRRALDPGATA